MEWNDERFVAERARGRALMLRVSSKARALLGAVRTNEFQLGDFAGDQAAEDADWNELALLSEQDENALLEYIAELEARPVA